MAYTVPNPNVLLVKVEDKLGHQLVELKTRLVATGLWRVTGSGDGFTVQLRGQTAGVGGSYDVFTNAVQWAPYITYTSSPGWNNGPAGSMSRLAAWFILEEVGTGRCFLFQRHTGGGANDSPGNYTVKLAPGGFATTGATSTVPPAAVGAVGTWAVNPGIAYSTFQPPENGYDLWMQFGVAAAPDVGGVCPFWMAIYNRTTAVPVWGMLYESLDLTVSGDVHPFVFGTGAWNASSGFFNLFDSAVLYGGPTVVTTRRLSALSINGSAQPYPGAAQPLGPDGKWRAIRPPVNDSSGVWVGRCKNILAHPINRQYPTTYNVSTATPYVVLGQVLLPWATGVAPQSSP